MPYWQYVDGTIALLGLLAWALLCLEHREEVERAREEEAARQAESPEAVR
ncbi:hypothetical protein SEA_CHARGERPOWER_61 [Mycobacterium phage Chargerpower]|nr:hypothetical protein SEA_CHARGERPOWER_61 [Mycobacterium phage Chargerpower]